MTRIESFCLSVFISLCVGLAGFLWGMDRAEDNNRLATAKAVGNAWERWQLTNSNMRERERALREDERKNAATYLKTKEKQIEESNRIIADLHADNRRLRIPIRIQAAATPGAVSSGSVAGGAGEEGYADLAPGAAEFLIRLADRGDDAIRKHAAVVDAYDRLAAACSVPNQ